MPNAAIWKSAQDAIVAGDDLTLARLLAEHEKMFRTERPNATWFGGLTPNYKDGDARTIIAREHFFESWDRFAEFARLTSEHASAVARFEQAADAVVLGDEERLAAALKDNPGLVRARSTRSHHSTLLHYVGANGVESWRQRSPKNAVEIAGALLDAGSEIDAAADMYRGGCTTLGLVVTSCHPRDAGVQLPLIDLLLARGARIEPRGAAGGVNARLLVNSCLANGRPEAAEHLALRGAPLDLEAAAGIGRLELVKSFFGPDGSLERRRRSISSKPDSCGRASTAARTSSNTCSSEAATSLTCCRRTTRPACIGPPSAGTSTL